MQNDYSIINAHRGEWSALATLAPALTVALTLTLTPHPNRSLT